MTKAEVPSNDPRQFADVRSKELRTRGMGDGMPTLNSWQDSPFNRWAFAHRSEKFGWVLAGLRPAGEHGGVFQYCSANTDVLSWLVETVTSPELASSCLRAGSQGSNESFQNRG